MAMKTLLKWAGNKQKLAGQIDEAFSGPCQGTYFEPFVGSAAVFLHRRERGTIGEAVLSDVNPRLIEMHRAVRDAPADVMEELARLPGEGWREAYYDVRDAFNDSRQVGPAHAARFIWLNRAGFNGLYRENKSGRYNVPVGRYAKLRLPGEEVFLRISRLLEGTELVVADFNDILRRAGKGDQVYCDPPYVPLNQASAVFVSYSAGGFDLGAQQELANGSLRAAFRGAEVVLSNHDLPIVRQQLYPETSGFRVVARPMVARPISRKAASRKAVSEVIAAIGPLRHVA